MDAVIAHWFAPMKMLRRFTEPIIPSYRIAKIPIVAVFAGDGRICLFMLEHRLRLHACRASSGGFLALEYGRHLLAHCHIECRNGKMQSDTGHCGRETLLQCA